MLIMGPVLHSLIKLQSVENRLRAVKAKLTRCRRNVILQENQVRSLQNALEAKKEELMLMRVQADRLELELKSRNEAISKLRAALNMAKTNKEYAAVLTQLNTGKADNVKIENQILDLMNSIEADEAQCTELQSQIEEQKEKLKQVRVETEASASKYEAEMADIQAEWEKLAEEIPPEPIRVFKRVAETYDGEALAVVERQDGRGDVFTCGGCFMGLTTETANMLMTKDEIIRCPNCTRILVLETSES
jgi:hypothetical protein